MNITGMRGLVAALAVSGALAGCASNAETSARSGAAGQPNVRVGVLECNVGAGAGLIITSNKALTCRYSPARTDIRGEMYAGTIRKYGLDIGATGGGRMVWAVFAPSERIPQGALAGDYVGVSGQATVGVGAGANLLVGGFDNSINLQPLSVEAQTGLNLAVGVSSITLEPAVPMRQRTTREIR